MITTRNTFIKGQDSIYDYGLYLMALKLIIDQLNMYLPGFLIIFTE